MSVRLLLIAMTGAFLLSSAALAERASQSHDEPTRETAQENARETAHEQVRDAWSVRQTRQVLDRHFQSKRFELEATDNFVIVHDTNGYRARLRARLLERTHERFYNVFETFAALDSAPTPLVCVLFADRNDFAHYAQQVDWLDMSWSGGYYSSRTNRMALYDAEPHAYDAHGDDSHENAEDDREAREAQERDKDSKSTSGNTAAAASASASPPLNLASTTHEAAHQLAFNSGLQRRGVMYPFWLSEGLACAFETNSADESFGLGQPNPTRLGDLRHALNGAGLVPLHEFITMVRPPTNNPQRLNTVYAQAWAFFRFLYLHDREKLARYLRQLNQMPHGSRHPQALRREFASIFGPLPAVEHRWQMHLDTLR